MNKISVIKAVTDINRPVFTTREIATLRRGSLSATSQSLSLLAEKAWWKK